MLEQGRCQQEYQCNSKRADDTGQLRFSARSLGYRGPRRTAADWKAVKEPSRQIGGSESHHFLIRVNVRAQTRRVGTRENARVGKRYQGDGAAPAEDRAHRAVRN